MKQKHTGYYYIFNTIDKTENISRLHNETFSDINILDKKTYFPLGSYLSGFIEIASSICSIENTDNIDNYCEKCIKQRKEYLPINDDKYFKSLSEVVCCCVNNMNFNGNIYRKLGTITNLCAYVDLCADLADRFYKDSESNESEQYDIKVKESKRKLKEYCNLDMLLQFANMNGLILKQGYIFTIINNDNKLKLNMDLGEVEQCIEKYSTKGNINKLPQIQIYKIDELSDLILASLQVIFSQRKIIRECKGCYRYFVPLNRNDQKYCDYTVINDSELCKEQMYDRHRNYKYKNKKIKEKYDLIKNRLVNRYNNVTSLDENTGEYRNRQKRYWDFLSEYTEIADKVKDRSDTYYTEEHLIEWLEQKDEETKTIE